MASSKQSKAMLIARADYVNYSVNSEVFEHGRNMKASYYVEPDSNPEMHVIEIETKASRKFVGQAHYWRFDRDLVDFHIHGNTIRFNGHQHHRPCVLRIFFVDKHNAPDEAAARAFSRQIRGWMGRNAEEKSTRHEMRLIRRFNYTTFYDNAEFYRRTSWYVNDDRSSGNVGKARGGLFSALNVVQYDSKAIKRDLVRLMAQSCGLESGLSQVLDDEETIRRYEAYNNWAIVKALQDRTNERLELQSFSAYFEPPYNKPHMLTNIANRSGNFEIVHMPQPDSDSMTKLMAHASVACPINNMPEYAFPKVDTSSSLMWCFIHETHSSRGSFKPLLVLLPNSVRDNGAIQTMFTYALRPDNYTSWTPVLFFVAATENFGNDHPGQAAQPIRWFRFVETLINGQPLDGTVNWVFTLLPPSGTKVAKK